MTIAMYFMINQVMKDYARKFKVFSTMPLLGVIKSTSQMKLYNDYNELGLHSLKFRRWFRNLCLFFKIEKHGIPEYLFNIILQSNHQYNTLTTDNIATLYCRKDAFKCFYFPATIIERSKLGVKLR